MKNLKLLSVILFSIIIFSCKKDKTLTNTPGSYVLGPKTVIIDNATSLVLESVDSVKVVFDGNTTQLESLTVGSIIISGIAPNAPYGFLRKITNIQKTGTTYTFTTVEIPLEEAFEELHVDYTKTFTTADTAGRVSSTDFSIDLPNIILHDGDGNNSTTADQVKLSESVTITPSFRFAVDISRFKLQYAIVEGRYQTVLDQSLIAGGSVGSITKEINILEKPLAAYPLPGLPFLIVVPNLRVSLGASASINVSITATQKITSDIKAFIEYKNSNWYKDYTQTMQTTYTFPGINGSATAKVYVEPAIDFKLYNSNWAKGSVSAQGYLKATGTLLPTPDCELKAGLSAGAEANLKFFGWNFTAASYPDIFDYSKVLFSCNNKPITKFTADATTINVGNSVHFSDSSTNNPTSWLWAFQGGNPSTSAAQNPTVSYATAGTYNVSLIATNSKGSDTLTKAGYIHVTNCTRTAIVLTDTVTNITNTTAKCSYRVVDTGCSQVVARGVCWATTQNPTVLNDKTYDGYGIGSYTSNITGLQPNTTYYLRAYAQDIDRVVYGAQRSFTTPPAILANCGTVTDIDGNVYNTVTIGTQCWMVENLKTTRYNDGTTISNVTDDTQWNALTTGAWCYYNNDISNNTTYGKLYNWRAVNTGKLAPIGWHIPSDAEWTTLIDYLGGTNVAGGSMKSSDFWNSPNLGATNTSGFTGLPAGARYNSGFFFNIGDRGAWYSSTEIDASTAWNIGLRFDKTWAYRANGYKTEGCSIRCIKD